MVNPYLPNQPVTPDSFAGRAELIAKVDDAIDAAQSSLKRSTAILLHGYRGSGKTSAIRKVRSILSSRVAGMIGIEVQLLASSNDEKLLTLLLDNLRAQPKGAAPFWGRIAGLLARVRSVTSPVFGVELSEAAAATPTTAQALWNECVAALEGAPLIFIAIDDADYLTDEGLGFLKTIAESHSKTPLVLVVAGGPLILDKMSEAHLSPVARIFSGAKFNIGELSRDETFAAIDAPPKEAGISVDWSSDAKSRIFEYSHGYPYLVQCLAHSAFERSATSSAEGVESSLELALRTGEDWLYRALPNASEEDVRSFIKILGTGKSSLRSSDMTSLGIRPPYIGRLVRARVLRKISYGHYDVIMAPVIGYYHALRRGISTGTRTPT